MNMNKKGFANIILVAIVVILVSVAGYFVFVKKSFQVTQQPTTPAPNQTASRLTLNILQNAQYNSFRGDGSIAGGFKLTNGIHYTQPLAGESQQDYYQKLDTDHIAFGDLNNDKVEDAAVIIIERGGGTGTYRTLKIVLNKDGRPDNVADLNLGDRTGINAVTIQSGIISIDMTPFYPTPWGDAGVKQIAKFQLFNNKLIDITIKEKTANWKTYRNDKYGFEIKYPADFKITLKESTVEEIEKKGYKLLLNLIIEDPKTQVAKAESNGGLEYFSMDIWKNDGSYDSLFQGPFPRKTEPTEISDSQQMIKRTINNIEGIERYGYTAEGHNYADGFYYKNNLVVWTVSLDPILEGRIKLSDWPRETRPKPKDNEIYKGIISNFRLIHSAAQDTKANWKTYRNEEYGFEVNYPNLSSWAVLTSSGPLTAGFYFGPEPAPVLPNGVHDQSKWGIQIFNKSTVTTSQLSAHPGSTRYEKNEKIYIIFNEGLRPDLFGEFSHSFKFVQE